VRVDRGYVGETRNLEDQRQPGLARLDVEHQTGGLAGCLRLGVVRRDRAGGVGRALVAKSDRPLVGAADLAVVARADGAAETRRLVLDRRVRSRGVGEALAEERTAGERCRVDL
jgi:GNAT superfamily N-acetyltransferase